MKFLNDVHEYCGVERSVTFYAERCCLSPKYFARLVTESLGKKPGDIIKENVEAVNDKMTNYKRVKRIKLREIEFEKTTTRKIKRTKGGVRVEE